MKPETPLPWDGLPEDEYSPGRPSYDMKSADYEFCVHACNAYPKLIDLLRKTGEASGISLDITDELKLDVAQHQSRKLLKELGEY